MAKSVFKKISLPVEPVGTCCPSFPIPDALGHIRFRGKSQNKVGMVGHDHGGMDIPNADLHLVTDRFQKSAGGFRVGKRRQRTILGATGDEKRGPININPQREIVGKRFATDIHPIMIRGIGCYEEFFSREMDRRAVPFLRRSRLIPNRSMFPTQHRGKNHEAYGGDCGEGEDMREW